MLPPNEKKMWYAAALLFRSEVDAVPNLRPLCEERIVLFDAQREDEADNAARQYGRRDEHAYANVHDELVRWVFVGIDKLEALSSPTKDGWEVASKFTRRSLNTLQRLEIKEANNSKLR